MLAGATVAGCGIRATSVPVDDGPAPSRVACAVEHDQEGTGTGTPQAGPDGELRIALVCSGRVVDVRRQVPLRQGESAADRLAAARTLLAELRREPGPREQEAGFTTAVPEDLRVSAPDPDDDTSALRLSRHPNELPPFALAQIVCTFAATTIADANRQVLLGGPGNEPGKPLKLYECGTALRTTTEAAETAGVPF
ncbi:hypothetical protein GL263_22835 [Streptomyces durbertensis]|uniref:Lipoprotein n=1 Tax=Streptomyces durbertensis TaxID=2448886 RepID=A0ABR6EM92_9ACTN|nr:hypothetical protein [Streptomyces durbertensis]